MCRDDIIVVTAGSCCYQILLPNITLFPVENWRKFCKLMVKYDGINKEAVERLNIFFPDEITAAKERWETAKRNYSNGYRLPAGHPLADSYTAKEARSVAAENKRLMQAVKKAKSQLDRVTKFYNIFKGAI